MQSNRLLLPFSLTILGLAIGAQAANAQITADTPQGGTGALPTVVTPAGNVFNITGGTTVDTNLFHGFSQFNVGSGQTANFNTPAAIQNVLARVSGGTASYINGVVQLSGNAGANLYLMNPAGVLFGPNATLSVPASFTATTATAIGFGANPLVADNYFNAVDGVPGGFQFGNTYANLTGAPVTLLFQTGATGSVVNQGANLQPGGTGTLALLGSSVLNAADINAPGRSVVAASLPNPEIVRLSVPGNLLSLEFPPGTFQAPNGFTSGTDQTFAAFTPQSLPQLITGTGATTNGIAAGAGGVTVNGGVVTVTGAGGGAGGAGGAGGTITFNSGDLFTRNITVAGAATGSAGPNVGNVILIGRGNTFAGNIDNGIAQGATVAPFTFNGTVNNGGTVGGGTVRLVSGFSGGLAGGAVGTANANSIQVGNISGGQIILDGGTSITGGEFITRGITTGRNGAITLNANGSGQPGNITVTNLFANSNADAAGAGGNININVPGGIFRSTGTISTANLNTAPGGVAQTLTSGATGGAGSAVSVAATGNINISQLGGGAGSSFVQGANLERDANGVIVYRLGSNQNIRVLITGLNADGSYQLINAETGAAIAGGGNVIVRQLNNASTISTTTGGGANGLIIRLNRTNNFLTTIAGDTRVSNNAAQTIVLRSTNGAIQTGSASATVLPGAAPGSTGAVAPGGGATGGGATGGGATGGGTTGGGATGGGTTGGGTRNNNGTSLLNNTVDDARSQLERDNTTGISGAEIAAAAANSPVVGSAESTLADEGVLTRKVAREVPIPQPEVPVVIEDKKEEKPKPQPKPQPIRVLPQLW